MKTTSELRVDSLIALSDKIYPVIDSEIQGETRARRILRLGIQVVAHTLETAPEYPLVAGDHYHALLRHELSPTIMPADYAAWPGYAPQLAALPRPQPALILDQPLDSLARAYADVPRGTMSANGEFETDASHAIHLSALALPYAAEYYPEFDQSKIAVYCLIHDLVEAYAGDVLSLGMSKADEARKNRDEAAALRRITNEFSESFPRFVAAIHDYENLVDDEARFVKTFDKVDPSFTHFANHGRALRNSPRITSSDTFRTLIDETTERMRPYSGGFPEVMEDRRELTERIIAITPWNESV